MANKESRDALDEGRAREPVSEDNLGSIGLALTVARPAIDGAIPVQVSDPE